MSKTIFHKCEYLEKNEKEVAILKAEGKYFMSLREIDMLDCGVIVRDFEYCPFCGIKLGDVL